MLGRRSLQSQLGDFLDYSTWAAKQNGEIDHQELFEEIAENFLQGMRLELISVFGPNKTTSMMNAYKPCRISPKKLEND